MQLMTFSFKRVQLQSKISITKLMSLLGALTAGVFAIAIPSVYYAISIHETQHTLMIEAAFLAKYIEKIIQARPDMWEFESTRLKELISQPSTYGGNHEREIRTAGGKLVTKNDFTEARPIISVSATFFDSGRLAGSIVFRHSLRTQIITTVLLGILSSLLGYLIYFIFRTYPIRKLERTLTDLQWEKDKSEKTLYAIGDGVISVDHKGNILFINRAAQSLVGMDTSEAVGRQLEDVYVLRRGQETQVREKRGILTSKEGNEYIIEEVRTPLAMMEFGKSGKVIVFRDITKRKLAEQILLQQREELSHVSRLATVGEFAASVAHEVHQPLAAILNNAQAAQRFLSSGTLAIDEVRDALQDIIDDDRRASEVIRHLRSFLKRKDADQAILDINTIIEEVLTILHHEIVDRQVYVTLALSPDIPHVEGDRIELQQVIMNLILNGCDSLVNVDLKRRQMHILTSVDEPNSIVVAVQDSGAGLDATEIDRVFEPFYTTKPEGLGMGLSISKSIIAAHSGRIWAVNNPEGGATFYFALPIYKGNALKS